MCAAGEQDAIVFRLQTSHNNKDIHDTFAPLCFSHLAGVLFYLLWSVLCELHLVNNHLLFVPGVD